MIAYRSRSVTVHITRPRLASWWSRWWSSAPPAHKRRGCERPRIGTVECSPAIAVDNHHARLPRSPDGRWVSTCSATAHRLEPLGRALGALQRLRFEDFAD